mmetsp:Transcript_42964/g.114927  ORF Transcript_42964/g.114927 Transcript_42964/m.114927 type:complete len:224 (+) Transcript_42964:510-1181(+)
MEIMDDVSTSWTTILSNIRSSSPDPSCNDSAPSISCSVQPITLNGSKSFSASTNSAMDLCNILNPEPLNPECPRKPLSGQQGARSAREADTRRGKSPCPTDLAFLVGSFDRRTEGVDRFKEHKPDPLLPEAHPAASCLLLDGLQLSQLSALHQLELAARMAMRAPPYPPAHSAPPQPAGSYAFGSPSQFRLSRLATVAAEARGPPWTSVDAARPREGGPWGHR